jgi:uncharacterized protein YecT (DUF1311 family)
MERLIIAAALLTCSHAIAQPAPDQSTPDMYSVDAPAYEYNRVIKSCSDRLECYKAAFRKSEQELNEAYQTRLSKIWPEKVAGLRDAQQVWIPAREKSCSWASNLGKGLKQEDRQTIYYTCMLEGSINRKYWLIRATAD